MPDQVHRLVAAFRGSSAVDALLMLVGFGQFFMLCYVCN